MAFETLTEPHYVKPTEPAPPKRVKDGHDVDYDAKIFSYKMQANKYAKAHDKWAKCQKNWKNNRSCMFAIVLQHCPVGLAQRLKSKDLWLKVNLGKDVISLTLMVRAD